MNQPRVARAQRILAQPTVRNFHPAQLFARVSLAALALALTACGANSARVEPTAVPELPAPAAPTYRVQRGLVLRQIEFSSRAQPADSAQLSFGADGKVRVVNVKGGDNVTKGQVLAELDLSDVRTQLQQAQIQFRTAQAVLSDTQKTYSRTVQLAQLDLDQAKIRLDQARARAGASSVTTLKNDLQRNAQRIEDINHSIADARSRGNQAGADNAAKLLKDAQIEREKLQAQFDSAAADSRVKSLDIVQLENEVKRLELTRDSKVEKIDPQLFQAVESAKVNIAALEEKLNRGSLIAPFDGVVALQPLSVADNVKALDPTIIVARPGALELVTTMTDPQLVQISVGQPVTCMLANQPTKPVNGVIKRVPIIGETKDRLVRIQLGDGIELQNGVLGRCDTVLDRADDALWLPPTAIRKFRGREYVVVQEADGRQRRVDVKTGVDGNDRVELLDGVKEGDLVVAQ